MNKGYSSELVEAAGHRSKADRLLPPVRAQWLFKALCVEG